jgi:hypothetical protein
MKNFWKQAEKTMTETQDTLGDEITEGAYTVTLLPGRKQAKFVRIDEVASYLQTLNVPDHTLALVNDSPNYQCLYYDQQT